MPDFGNDSRPAPSAPQSLITHRNDAPPRSVSSSRNRRAALGAGLLGQHALVLGEARAAVHRGSSPGRSRAGRRSARDAPPPRFSLGRCGGSSSDVERLHRSAARAPTSGQSNGNAQAPLRARERRRRLVRLGPAARHQDAAAQGLARARGSRSTRRSSGHCASRPPSAPRCTRRCRGRARSPARSTGWARARAGTPPRGCARSAPSRPAVARNSSRLDRGASTR